ncbi:MAG: hypothetical protein AB1861_20875 [Cyanobacteriota bacterium]
MLGAIHQLLADCRYYRRWRGGKWYHVRVIALDFLISGWVRSPEPFEEIIGEETHMGIIKTLKLLFGESAFDESNQDRRPSPSPTTVMQPINSDESKQSESQEPTQGKCRQN